MIVYTIVSPLMGWLGDRYSRKVLLASRRGVVEPGDGRHGILDRLHSSVLLAGIPGDWRGKLRRDRAGTYSPTFSRSSSGAGRWGLLPGACRSARRWGYILGGTIADAMGWRAVFFVVGLPGLLAAAGGAVDQRPGARRSEGGSGQQARRPGLSDYLELFRTRTFLYNTAGMAAVTFATGAYAAWGSMFYQRVHGLTATEAGQHDRRPAGGRRA